MNLYMNKGTKGEESPLNGFILLSPPTLLVVILAWVD